MAVSCAVFSSTFVFDAATTRICGVFPPLPHSNVKPQIDNDDRQISLNLFGLIQPPLPTISEKNQQHYKIIKYLIIHTYTHPLSLCILPTPPRPLCRRVPSSAGFFSERCARLPACVFHLFTTRVCCVTAIRLCVAYRPPRF